MKLKLILQLVFLGFIVAGQAFPAFAQTTGGTSNLGKDDFTVSLSAETQSPINGEVPLIFTVTPKSTYKSVFIKWKSSEKVEFTGKSEIFTSLQKGEEYTFKQNVKPLKSGTHRITAIVEAVESDATYINSDQLNLTFNKSLIRTPITEEYQSYEMLWIGGRVIIALVILILIILGVIIGRRKFQEWLTKD